jgi:hypothetical protein
LRPEARGRSERTFGTLQGRLAKELRLFDITDIDAANRYIREIYLPMHNKLFARPPQTKASTASAVLFMVRFSMFYKELSGRAGG